MELASEAATPELQRHFLTQAEVWAELAERGPDGTAYAIAPANPDSAG